MVDGKVMSIMVPMRDEARTQVQDNWLLFIVKTKHSKGEKQVGRPVQGTARQQEHLTCTTGTTNI